MVLKAKQIEHAKEGMHSDGGGLYLKVQASGSKSWMFRYQIDGKRRAMGLGALADTPSLDARSEAAKLALLVRSGVDPITQRDEKIEAAKVEAARADTFSMVAAEYIASHRAGWANAKHAAQWSATLTKYAYPFIGAKPVSDVTTEDVLRILKPIWATKTETASRVRSRIELVLSYAKALKLRAGENPAAWRGHLDALLPKPSKVAPVVHHPALPYIQMREFAAAMRTIKGSGAKALQFAILTAARSGEVRLATWSEIDLEAKTWSIPAQRMKAKRDHRVPLSDAAVALLVALPRIKGNDYLFVSDRQAKPLSDMTLTSVIRRMNEELPPRWVDTATGAQAVPHGFRSSFRDWAAETTTYPNEMVEMALAHSVGDKVEAAYRRGDMFEKRRELMQSWAGFIGA